jgi:hypothetical protein
MTNKNKCIKGIDINCNCDKMELEVREVRKYSDNLIDRLGGWWFIMFVGVLGLVAGMILSQFK